MDRLVLQGETEEMDYLDYRGETALKDNQGETALKDNQGETDYTEHRDPLGHKVQSGLLVLPLEVWFTQDGETVLAQTLLERN